ncbi:MAG TPA: hypothetical protein VJJ81_04400 [Candidatus Babeliales bacterium]|nr:hypothetical protein [Candidatus Babeliales bacterium]
MYPKIIVISLLIFSNFAITNLLSCEKAEPSSPAHTIDTRFAVPIPADAPSVSSLITRIAELHVALGIETHERTELLAALSAEMHAREQLKVSLQQELASQDRKYTSELSQLQARVRALEQR